VIAFLQYFSGKVIQNKGILVTLPFKRGLKITALFNHGSFAGFVVPIFYSLQGPNCIGI